MSVPRVSVIIPTYNRADLLARTLESVLAQTYQDIEVIVADDGSTDDTALVVERYGSRVRYVRQDNHNHEGATRNLGIRHSSGDFVACVDSDDLWAPTKLEKQMRLACDAPEYGLVYCDAWCFDGVTGQTLYEYHDVAPPSAGWIGPALIMRNFIPCPSILIRRSVLDEVGLFSEDPVLRMRADWELWLRIAARHQVGFVPETLAGYRVHARNATRREDPVVWHRSCLRVIDSATAFAPEVYGPVRREALSTQYLHAGSTLVKAEDYGRAGAMYAESIRLWPRQIRAYPFLLATAVGAPILRPLARPYARWRHARVD